MLGGIFGQLIGGLGGNIEEGMKKGLHYIGEVIKIFSWAQRTGNIAALVDATHVAMLWLQELTDQFGNIPQHVLDDLLKGGDPFAPSRFAAQALDAKYGAASQAWYAVQPRA